MPGALRRTGISRRMASGATSRPANTCAFVMAQPGKKTRYSCAFRRDWERDALINNRGGVTECLEKLGMIWHFWHCDEGYGRPVAEGH